MPKCLKYLLFPFLLVGCVSAQNPYSEFFRPQPNINDTRAISEALDDKPKLFQGTDFQADMKKMSRLGYVLLGVSSFYGTYGSANDAIAQAKNIGASAVVVQQKYKNTVSGAMPITLPDVQTTYHSGSISGTGGGASYSGSYEGASSTFATSTTYMPYSVDRYDFVASFWAKVRQGGLGVLLRDLTDEEKQSIESNKGATVLAVVNGRAAFDADVLPGDILVSVNDVPVVNESSATEAIRASYGETVALKFWRNGDYLIKKITIPAIDAPSSAPIQPR